MRLFARPSTTIACNFSAMTVSGGINAQAGRRQVEQHWQFQLGNARFNRLGAQAAIFQILADKIDLEGHNIEDNVVDMHIVRAPGRHQCTSEAPAASVSCAVPSPPF
jgi:hypothetical protein